MAKRFNVTIYTDGSCKGNGLETNVGGYAAVIVDDRTGKELRISGFESNTTNNAMELAAVLEGIRALKRPCDVKIISDSTYVCNVANTIREFKSRNWYTKAGKLMSNYERWQSLISVCKLMGHKLKFEHIKGHAGHPFNEECDKLAVEAAASGRASIALVAPRAI